MKLEDAQPQVGIFEIIDGNVYILTDLIENCKEVNGQVDAGHLFHKDLCKIFFSKVSKESQKLLSMNNGFLLFDRGRVCYDYNLDKFIIYGNRDTLLNQEYVSVIQRYFHLNPAKTKLVVDPFYTRREL